MSLQAEISVFDPEKHYYDYFFGQVMPIEVNSWSYWAIETTRDPSPDWPWPVVMYNVVKAPSMEEALRQERDSIPSDMRITRIRKRIEGVDTPWTVLDEVA